MVRNKIVFANVENAQNHKRRSFIILGLFEQKQQQQQNPLTPTCAKHKILM